MLAPEPIDYSTPQKYHAARSLARTQLPTSPWSAWTTSPSQDVHSLAPPPIAYLPTPLALKPAYPHCEGELSQFMCESAEPNDMRSTYLAEKSIHIIPSGLTEYIHCPYKTVELCLSQWKLGCNQIVCVVVHGYEKNTLRVAHDTMSRTSLSLHCDSLIKLFLYDSTSFQIIGQPLVIDTPRMICQRQSSISGKVNQSGITFCLSVTLFAGRDELPRWSGPVSYGPRLGATTTTLTTTAALTSTPSNLTPPGPSIALTINEPAAHRTTVAQRAVPSVITTAPVSPRRSWSPSTTNTTTTNNTTLPSPMLHSTFKIDTIPESLIETAEMTPAATTSYSPRQGDASIVKTKKFVVLAGDIVDSVTGFIDREAVSGLDIMLNAGEDDADDTPLLESCVRSTFILEVPVNQRCVIIRFYKRKSSFDHVAYLATIDLTRNRDSQLVPLYSLDNRLTPLFFHVVIEMVDDSNADTVLAAAKLVADDDADYEDEDDDSSPQTSSAKRAERNRRRNRKRRLRRKASRAAAKERSFHS